MWSTCPRLIFSSITSSPKRDGRTSLSQKPPTGSHWMCLAFGPRRSPRGLLVASAWFTESPKSWLQKKTPQFPLEGIVSNSGPKKEPNMFCWLLFKAVQQRYPQNTDPKRHLGMSCFGGTFFLKQATKRKASRFDTVCHFGVPPIWPWGVPSLRRPHLGSHARLPAGGSAAVGRGFGIGVHSASARPAVARPASEMGFTKHAFLCFISIG